MIRLWCFLSGLWGLLLFMRAQMEPLPFALSFFLWLIGVLLIHAACIDSRTYRLPNKFIYLSAFLALTFSCLVFEWQFAVFGALLGFGALKTYQLVYRFLTQREGCGSGDTKLMLSLGALTGPYFCCPVIWTGIFAATLHLKLSGTPHTKNVFRTVPLGPYLVGAGLLTVLLQPVFM